MKEEKKTNFRLYSLIALLIGVLLIIIGGVILLKGNTKLTPPELYVPSAKEDFYENVNIEKLQKVTVPTNSNAWSTFYDAQTSVNTKKQIILQQLLNDPNYTNENVSILVDQFNDFETRNKAGLKELKPYFDMIDNAKTMEEFNKAIIKIDYDLGVSAFVNLSAETDIRNGSRKVLLIGNAKVEDMYEVYTLDKFAAYKEAYLKFRKSVLKLYGYSDEKIEEVSNKIDEFTKKIQEKSKTISDITDITKLYNYYTIEDIKTGFKNLPIMSALKTYKVDNLENYVFYDFDHLVELDKYWTLENLDILKEIEKIVILEQVGCTVTTDDYFKAYQELVNDTQGTKLSAEDLRYHIETQIKEGLMEEDLNKAYEKAYFTDENKQEVRDLINEIKEYYKKIIENCDWMQESTRKEALKKIEDMKVHIGYQEKKASETIKYTPKSEGGTLIGNMIKEERYNSANFHKEFETDGAQEFKNLEVNAYYMSVDNSINFPAAFYELASGETNYYKRLGKFGTIIGHEMSHAFDNTGSQFDSEGKLRNWWTEEDLEKYNELKKKIIEYFGNYETQGIKVDGDRTQGENIADLAGVKAMIYIIEQHNATNQDYKDFFESYARLWAQKIPTENLEKQMAVDTHSPNKIRVNAVLSSMDKFYEVYGITEKDKMYVAKENRVGIW